MPACMPFGSSSDACIGRPSWQLMQVWILYCKFGGKAFKLASPSESEVLQPAIPICKPKQQRPKSPIVAPVPADIHKPLLRSPVWSLCKDLSQDLQALQSWHIMLISASRLLQPACLHVSISRYVCSCISLHGSEPGPPCGRFPFKPS